MAKSFKRTLLVTFSLLFLFTVALFAAACSPVLCKVTLDFDKTKGTVVLAPEADESTYESGTEVTVTVTPNADYEVDTFTVDGTAANLTNGSYTFTVEKDVTVKVTFKDKTPTPPPTPTMYNVSKAATENGTVTLDHEGSVAEGTVVTATIAPASGYELDTAKVNTTDVTDRVSDNKFTFTVEGETVVTVTFKSTTPPTPPLSISTKWHGTYTGENMMADNDPVWVLSITATSVSLTIDGDAQTITDIVFAQDDNSFTFTLDGETVTVEVYDEDDDLGINTLSASTDNYSVVATLEDASKFPPEPPIGKTITEFPADFRGTWYASYFDEAFYTIDITTTTMTITVDDGDPTTINVADVLYDEDGPYDDGTPTIYFTYNGAEESSVDIDSDNELSFTSGDDIYVYGFTHDKPVHYGDASAFLTEIEGSWLNTSSLGDTNLVVSGGKVTEFVFRGTDYTDSTYVLGLDEDGKLVIEAGDELYYFSYSAEYGTLNLTHDYDDFDLDKTEIENTLPSDYIGKWVKIGDVSYIEVAQDGTAKYYISEGGSSYDITISGVGGVYTLDCLMVEGEVSLKENNRVLSVDNRNFAKDGVEIPDEEKIPEALRGTTWTSVDEETTYVFDTDGLKITVGEVEYYVYLATNDTSSSSCTFNAYSGSDVHVYVYYTSYGGMTLDGDSIVEAEGGGASDSIPADFDGTYKTTDSSHTVVIADGGATVDGSSAEVSYDSGFYTVTAGAKNYTILFVDMTGQGNIFVFLYDTDDDASFALIPDGSEPTNVDSSLAGTWNGSTDDWMQMGEDDFISVAGFLDDIEIVIGEDGSVKVDGKDFVVYYATGSVEDGALLYLAASADTVLYLYYETNSTDEMTIGVSGADTYGGICYNTVTRDGGEVTPPQPGTAIDKSLYGVWRGVNGSDSYVVTIDAEGVHFVRGNSDPVDGKVHDIAADGLTFDVDVTFPPNSVPYYFHAVYSASTGQITLTEAPYTTIVLTKDSDDMETIPSGYQGKWSLVEYRGSKVIGSMEVTTNTISMTLNGQSYGPIHITLDDVNGTKVTFTAGNNSYQLTLGVMGDATKYLGLIDPERYDPLIATLQEEGFAGYTVPDSAKGDYHTEDNNVTVTVGDTITATIGGKEVTLDVVGLTESENSVHIDVTSADGGTGSFEFSFGDGADTPASYTFNWAADGHSVTPYELIKDAEEEVPDHPLTGTWKTFSEDSAFEGKDIVVNKDGTVTVGGGTASLSDAGENAWTLVYNGKNYSLSVGDTYGDDVILINDPNYNRHFAYNAAATPIALTVSNLVGTWKNDDSSIVVIVDADGITLNDGVVFVFGYYNSNGYKILAGNVRYNLYTDNGETATLYNDSTYMPTTLTRESEAVHALAGDYHTQEGDTSAFGSNVAVVITNDGKLTVNGVDATLTGDSSYTATVNDVEYTVKLGTSDTVLTFTPAEGNAIYAIRDGAVSPYASKINTLLGYWTTADGAHIVVVTADGITFDGKEGFVTLQANLTTLLSVKFLWGGEEYLFKSTNKGAAAYIDKLSGVKFTKTDPPITDCPLAGNYTIQKSKSLGSPAPVVITADGKMTVRTMDAKLTGSEGSYTCSLGTIGFSDTFGNDVLVISSSSETLYAIRDGASPAVELNLLVGTWRTGDGMHTIDVSADGITYDDVAVYVYGYYANGQDPDSGYKLIHENKLYNFYSTDGTSATFYDRDAASSTAFTKDGGSSGGTVDEEWLSTYSWVITEEPWLGRNKDKSKVYSLTIKNNDGHLAITFSIDDEAQAVTNIAIADTEITFTAGGETWSISLTSSSKQVTLTDPTEDFPGNSHELKHELEDIGGGSGGSDDGVYTFSPNLLSKYVGVWTGTDSKGHNWTITVTETTVKVECDGVVQELTDIKSYGNQYCLDFKINGNLYSFWDNSGQVLQIVAESDWVTLTKS